MDYSNAEICDFIKDLDAVIFVLDKKSLRFTWFSEGICRLTGLEEDDAAKHAAAFLHACQPADRDFIQRMDQFFEMDTSETFQGSIRLMDPKGNWKWVIVSAGFVDSEDIRQKGAIVGMMLPLHERALSSSHGLTGRELALNLHQPALQKLTAREKQILSLISRGYTCSAIAIELSLSFYTIDTYRKKLLRKLNVPNIAALAALAGECGLR